MITHYNCIGICCM